ncbi:MAG: hypothetical protein JNK40_11100 [Chromatiales bacterium]|nr:hypothetical protein [Chromatiales bacterium]
MTPTEQKSLLSIAMLAAFADQSKTDRERDEVRQVAESLGSDLNVAAIYQDVLLGRTGVASAAAGLSTPALRQLAYEIAIGVCDADGLRNDAETRFLASLGNALGLNQPAMDAAAVEADALATAPLESVAVAVGIATATTTAAQAPEAGLDRDILHASILNGALELLPQSMASLAIIPLQMRLVYRVGTAYGFQLDRGHIKDLLATLGVGLTGQYLEGIGRKLIGGLLGSVGKAATGAAFSFATTYALGQVAKRYYAGGRVMSTAMLQQAFAEFTAQGRSLQQQYLPRIQEQARTLDLGKIMSAVGLR